MEEPRIPSNEKERLDTLLRLKILDTPSEDRYDRYTRICTRLFDTPIAIISLVDRYRQWFKSSCGLDASETPRNVSFCGHAILGDGIFEVCDASQDQRFQDNPLVTGMPNIRFYAGAPLTTPNRQNIGTLCIIDKSPRRLTDDERIMLRNIADMVVDDMVKYIDLATGLDNRTALISAGDGALALARPDKLFKLALLDVSIIVKWLESGKLKNSWRESFASNLQDQFGHATSIAHLGGDQYCIFYEDSHTLCDTELLQRACAKTDKRLLSESIFLAHIPVKRSDSISIEELLRDADAMFFGGKRGLLPEPEGKH